MDIAEIVKLAATNGLGIVLSVIIAIGLGWVLRFVLKENAKREDRLATIIENHLHSLTDSVSRINQAITDKDRQTQEVYRYQREEHQEMIRLLVKLNGKT